MPALMWPGDKSPLVLTLSDVGNQGSNENDLRLLYHFQTYTSRELGSAAFDKVYDNFTLSIALEVCNGTQYIRQKTKRF